MEGGAPTDLSLERTQSSSSASSSPKATPTGASRAAALVLLPAPRDDALLAASSSTSSNSSGRLSRSSRRAMSNSSPPLKRSRRGADGGLPSAPSIMSASTESESQMDVDPGEGQFASMLSVRLLGRRIAHATADRELEAIAQTVRIQGRERNQWDRIPPTLWASIVAAVQAFETIATQNHPFGGMYTGAVADSPDLELHIVVEHDAAAVSTQHDWTAQPLTTTSGIYLVSRSAGTRRRIVRLPEHDGLL